MPYTHVRLRPATRPAGRLQGEPGRRTLPSDEEVQTAVGGNNSLGTLLLVMALGLLVIAFTRGRRQQREVLGVQARLRPGVQVMTSSGLYATVVAVEDGVVTLETAPGQRSRWDKRAVVRVVTESGPSAVQSGDADAENESGGTAGRSDDEERPPGRE